jgi:hypothetical protein
VQVKILRRPGEQAYRSGTGEFYPKVLDALELHYAPNQALRISREELRELLAALQSDLECRDGVIRLIEVPEDE